MPYTSNPQINSTGRSLKEHVFRSQFIAFVVFSIPETEKRKTQKYKLQCPRGDTNLRAADRHTTMPTTNIKVNGNGKVILDTHPESDQHQN